MEQMKLDDILSGKDRPAPAAPTTPAPEAPAADTPPPTDAAPPPQEAPKAEPYTSRRTAHRDREQDAQGRVRDPKTGQFVPKEGEAVKEAPKEATPAAPAAPKEPAQDMSPKEKALLAAAQDERNKRQEFERKYKELEAKIATPPAPPKEPEAAKTFWEDPEGAMARHQAEVRGMITQERLVFSEKMARSQYQDFDEKLDVFEELMKETPALRQQMLASPDPAGFAYKTAKTHKELKDAGNLDELRTKIEKETRLKVEAELKEKMEKEVAAKLKEREALPGSLSNITSVGGNSRPAWGGPTSLDNILKS